MKTDFLVIGSGISGLNYSLKAAECGEVTIVTKKKVMESNTNYAQGGIAAALDPLDSYDQHIQDTIVTGDGLCDKEVVELVVKEAPEKIKELMQLGVQFNREEDRLSLTREGGHSKRRIVFVGDSTGHAVEQAFVSNVKKRSNVHILEGYFAFDLIIENGRCYGAYCLNNYDQEFEAVYAKATVMATGGLGRVYEKTSNPEIATGDGAAMAYRAGAEIEDIEFIQFHPTLLDKEETEPFLISEVVRGEGGILRNWEGAPFMEKYHKMKDLAPRDTVTRAIIAELEKGPVFLDLTTKKKQFLEERFPTIYKRLKDYGISMHRDFIPIIPAAHYACGGVKTDLNGRTNIDGLYAIGEVSRTGLHGANRLASNSLLGCLVFSLRTADASAKEAEKRNNVEKKIPEFRLSDPGEPEEGLRRKLRSLMWKKVGVIRNGTTLQEAMRELQKIDKEGTRLTTEGINERRIELRNMTTVAELITKAALIRTESRGTHYRTDYPRKDDINWRRSIKLTKTSSKSNTYI
ncbi:MAG: L-aspartate oxidase [Candidatus Bathyarchaeota archaeon]|nr:MAG: L-aspartate oxidase [Candidatus Bathyarchaeota archaeon]